jgi:transcriptional regulator with XRE-family HTH domain
VRQLGDVRVRLGERVKQIRLDRRMTQEDVAERSGLSYKFIGEVERGAANPSVNTLEKLAAGLGVELGHLCGSPLVYTPRRVEPPVVREVAASLEALASRLRGDTAPRRKGGSKKR